MYSSVIGTVTFEPSADSHIYSIPTTKLSSATVLFLITIALQPLSLNTVIGFPSTYHADIGMRELTLYWHEEVNVVDNRFTLEWFRFHVIVICTKECSKYNGFLQCRGLLVFVQVKIFESMILFIFLHPRLLLVKLIELAQS